MPHTVSEFLETLKKEMNFDPALSERVAVEMEEHFRDAVSEFGPESEAEVIARFGEPRLIAGGYVLSSLMRQACRLAFVLFLSILIVGAGMMSRFAWYAHVHWEPPKHAIATYGALLDRGAFTLTLLIAALGVGYLIRLQYLSDAAVKDGIRSTVVFLVVCIAASVSLAISVLLDVTFTASRFSVSGMTSDVWLPALSATAELAVLAGMLTFLNSAYRRAKIGSSLLRDCGGAGGSSV